MKAAEGHIVSLAPSSKVKMEDRKRSLAVDADDAYPSKRHASSANGTHIRMSDTDKEKDIEVCIHFPYIDTTRDYSQMHSHTYV